MNPEQLKAVQLAQAARPAAPSGPAKISAKLRALLAEQASEREAQGIDHHNAVIELREKHIAAVQALNESEKPAAPPPAAAPAPSTAHSSERPHGKNRSR